MILFLLNAWRLTCNVTSYISALFLRYPLQISLVLICLYCFHLKTRYDAIVSDYKAYRDNITHQAALQKVKNEILRKQSEKQVQDLTEIHTHNLEAVKHEYEKRNKLDAITISDLRIKLRDKIRSDSFTVPEIAKDTSLTTEEWRERYTKLSGQYQTLKEGCTITTLDFNTCRGWADAACDQVGCE